MKTESSKEDKVRFSQAVEKALARGGTGLHGSVGTQNEKLIHAALKNYYAPFSDEQEIKIGQYFADAVSEDGIFEIQTKQLYKLRGKLSEFLPAARVTVVHPFILKMRTFYIDQKTGEVIEPKAARRKASLLPVFEEIYSLREFIRNKNFMIKIVKINVDRMVYYDGKLPDIKRKNERKKCLIEKIPTEILEEISLCGEDDYRDFLPDGLPEKFTKNEFAKLCGESKNSLRLEVVRAAGLLKKVGKIGNAFLYSVAGR